MSAPFAADYFDGRTSRRHAVHVGVDAGKLSIRGDAVDLDVARSQVEVKPRVGGAPVRVALPGGGLLVVAEFDALEASLGVPRARTLAHRLESHAAFVVVALALLAVAAWFAYRDGIPWLSNQVAQRIAPEVESQLAEEALASVDSFLFQPSSLDADRKAVLSRSFANLAARAGVAKGTRLEFRESKLFGANAFTLPGGIIVVTDKLVYILDDRQVAAILAHELGHVHHRHGLRMLLTHSINALVVMAVFGDASGASAMAATLPTILINNGYSRAFEREADQYAFDLLKRSGGTPLDFAAALSILETLEHGARGEAPRFGYMSTHPDTGERIMAAREAAKR